MVTEGCECVYTELTKEYNAVFKRQDVMIGGWIMEKGSPTRITQTEAYKRGRSAAASAKNPYKIGTDDYNYWERAWNQQFKGNGPAPKSKKTPMRWYYGNYEPRKSSHIPSKLKYRYKEK